MIETRNGYGLARKIDGRYHLLTGVRNRCVQILFMQMPEPLKKKLVEMRERGEGEGVVLIQVQDARITEVPVADPITITPEQGITDDVTIR